MENERLDLVLQNIKSANSDMKSMYEARLNEKDKTIESLQDRIQNYLYDADGKPWLKKYKYRRLPNETMVRQCTGADPGFVVRGEA